jgi:hypothetical protein
MQLLHGATLRSPVRVAIILFLLALAFWQQFALIKARQQMDALRWAVQSAQQPAPPEVSVRGAEASEDLGEIMRLRGAVAQLRSENSEMVDRLRSFLTNTPAIASAIEPQATAAVSAADLSEDKETLRDIKERQVEVAQTIVGVLRQAISEEWTQYRQQSEVAQQLANSLEVPESVQTLSPQIGLNRNDLDIYRPYFEARQTQLDMMEKLNGLEESLIRTKQVAIAVSRP